METKILQFQNTQAQSSCSFNWSESWDGPTEFYATRVICKAEKKAKRKVIGQFYTKTWTEPSKKKKGGISNPNEIPGWSWRWVSKDLGYQYATNTVKEWGTAEDPVVVIPGETNNNYNIDCGCKCDDASKACSDSASDARESYSEKYQAAVNNFSKAKTEAKNSMAESCKSAVDSANKASGDPIFADLDMGKINGWYDKVSNGEFEGKKTKINYGGIEYESGKCADKGSVCGAANASFSFSFSAGGDGYDADCDDDYTTKNFAQINGSTVGSENFNIYIGI